MGYSSNWVESFSHWTSPMKCCRCAQVCSACLHDRLKTKEMLLLGLVFMAERWGWESCEKPNPLRLSQLPPDGDLYIASAHMPLAKEIIRLHSVSVQQKSICLIQEGTAAMTGDVLFSLYWEEKWKPEHRLNSAWKWKKKLVTGLHVRQITEPSKPPSETSESDPQIT